MIPDGAAAARESHRRFLNAYYGKVRHVYDPTRKYFLFGRDRALTALLAEPWRHLVEVGPGTGRNLAALAMRRPEARYGAVEASDAMLEVARRRCGFATMRQGFAEDADHGAVLGCAPDRVLFSYSLSMIQDQDKAIANARACLAPGGQVVIVDFGDMCGMPVAAPALKRFLRSFHVTAPSIELLERHGAQLAWGPGRYYVIARLGPNRAPRGAGLTNEATVECPGR